MVDFSFHKISEKEREEIKKEAKNLMDFFSKKLSKIKDIHVKDFIEKDSKIEFEREEKTHGKKETNNEGFSKKIMFENAPNKNKDFLIGEKGGW